MIAEVTRVRSPPGAAPRNALGAPKWRKGRVLVHAEAGPGEVDAVVEYGRRRSGLAGETSVLGDDLGRG